jgi:flagellar hook-associated protein 2
MGIDGLVSGLQTTDLINSLMQIESAPQTLLKSKQTETSSLVSALQALNTKVASLGESATKAAKAESWQAAKATSSLEGVTASVSTGASTMAGEVTFTVKQVATSKVMATAGLALGSTVVQGNPPAFTITRGDTGKAVQIKPASGSLQDVAAAINANADAGVRASVVRAGSDGDTPLYRLQLTGTVTGADEGSFTVTGIDGLVQTRAPQDAVVELAGVPGADGTTPVAETITQGSNTFKDLMLGVDVTVSAESVGKSATVSVARDDAALSKLASDLVGSLGVVLSEISSRTATTTSTGTDGATVVTGGVFSGEASVRDLQQRVLSAASYPVDGHSPSEAGIIINRDGTFTFDSAKFAEALAADPAKVQTIVSGLAQRVADVAEETSDPHEGTLTQQIEGQQSAVKDLGDQIADWDRRLALRREGLQATYSALEVTLSNLQSQSNWLTSQLASLTTSSSSK